MEQNFDFSSLGHRSPYFLSTACPLCLESLWYGTEGYKLSSTLLKTAEQSIRGNVEFRAPQLKLNTEKLEEIQRR